MPLEGADLKKANDEIKARAKNTIKGNELCQSDIKDTDKLLDKALPSGCPDGLEGDLNNVRKQIGALLDEATKALKASKAKIDALVNEIK